MSTVSTDPIADMLTRIRNAALVRKSEVVMPHSKIKESVAKLLKENGFIVDFKTIDAKIGKSLVVVISSENANSRITEISRLSKPGRRQYASYKEMPTVKNGRGIVIVSTSKGLMSGAEARKQQIGGELICKVY